MSLMLDLRFIRENPQAVRDAIRAKQLQGGLESLERLLTTDEEHRLVRRDLEEKQAAHNASNKRIGELRRAREDTSALMTEMAGLSAEVKRLEEKERALQQVIDTLMLEIPNLPHESVPYGESEHDNVIAKEWGEKREFAFEPKPHWELMAERGWVDLEAGVKVTEPVPRLQARRRASCARPQAYFLDRLGARLRGGHPALMVNTAGSPPPVTPDKEGQMYEVTDGFFLVPTSEVPSRTSTATASWTRPSWHRWRLTPLLSARGGATVRTRGSNRISSTRWRWCSSSPESSYQALEDMTASEGLLELLPYRVCSCAPATWASPRPRSTTRKCGARGRSAGWRSRASATWRRSKRGA